MSKQADEEEQGDKYAFPLVPKLQLGNAYEYFFSREIKQLLGGVGVVIINTSKQKA